MSAGEIAVQQGCWLYTVTGCFTFIFSKKLSVVLIVIQHLKRSITRNNQQEGFGMKVVIILQAGFVCKARNVSHYSQDF
jgi:hypothetical protein